MRYRDLEYGIFLSRDPLGFVDGPNVYTYVTQNPWTKFDPLGLKEKDNNEEPETKERDLNKEVENNKPQQAEKTNNSDDALVKKVVDTISVSKTAKGILDSKLDGKELTISIAEEGSVGNGTYTTGGAAEIKLKIDGRSEQDIVATLGHELGHHKDAVEGKNQLTTDMDKAAFVKTGINGEIDANMTMLKIGNELPPGKMSASALSIAYDKTVNTGKMTTEKFKNLVTKPITQSYKEFYEKAYDKVHSQ